MIEFKPQSLLNLIEKSNDFSELMKYKYPELIPELTTFSTNRNCTCKKKILTYMSDHLEEVSGLANSFIENRKDLKLDIESITKTFKPMSGLSVEIEPSPLAYTEMIKHSVSEKWMYRGLSVLETEKREEDGTSKIVWIVFFY